jgi:hypothetical protein
MSFLNLIKAQFGLSTTASDNYVAESTGAGTFRIRKGTLGSVGADVLTVDASGTLHIPNVDTTTVRQTVELGTVDSNGFAAFGGSTGSTTVTTATTLYLNAANGMVNRRGSITNPSWTGLSTNGTMYAYLDIAADGTCTTGSTTLAPVYQFGGTYSTTSGQFTFNIQEMIGKVGNGATAAQTYRVFVGEVTVAGGVVTAIIWYALMRRYYGSASVPGNGTAVVLSHNLGVPSNHIICRYGFACISADAGWGAAVGDFIPLGPLDNGASSAINGFFGRNSATINGTYSSLNPANKSTGNRAVLTSVANFNLVIALGGSW